MVFYYIIVILSIIRYLLIWLLSFLNLDNNLIKVLALIFLCLFCYGMKKIPQLYYSKPSRIKEYRENRVLKYKLEYRISHFLNIFVIIIYNSIFVLGIFFLRFSNINNTIDLKEYFIKIQEIIKLQNIFEIILNIALIIISFIVIIIIIAILSKYYKFHILKRHLYLMFKEPYDNFLLLNMHYFRVPNNIILYLSDHFKPFYKKGIQNKYSKQAYISLRNKIITVLRFVIFYGHYLLLMSIFFYDIFINNFVLQYFFYSLPFIFIYDVFLKVTTFFSQLHIPSDALIAKYLYSDIVLIDKEFAYFGSDLVELKHFAKIVHLYVDRGFIADHKNITEL